MAATTEARVETLTAEVRTLVVGKRQITLSVAKQLDVVPLWQLTVWGRVKLHGDNDHVIGCDADGNLALAIYDPFTRDRPLKPTHIGYEELSGRPQVCSRLKREQRVGNAVRRYRLVFGDHPISIDKDDVDECGIHEYPAHCDPWWSPRDTFTELRVICDGDVELQHYKKAKNEAAAAAPLIVLAGLK